MDDSADLLTLFAIFFRDLGYQVSLASDGVAALASIREDQPDLIITDQAMPRMSGLELCEELRAHPQTRHIPLIIHSGQPLSPAKGLYDRVLSKPADLREMSRAVSALLERPLGFVEPDRRRSQ